jgi:hypothetical protein
MSVCLWLSRERSTQTKNKTPREMMMMMKEDVGDLGARETMMMMMKEDVGDIVGDLGAREMMKILVLRVLWTLGAAEIWMSWKMVK